MNANLQGLTTGLQIMDKIINYDGTFCWQASTLGTYINSWNTTSVTINGTNATNLYVASGSYPAKIGGFWYVSYNSTVAWTHFESK
jgi:hypothetical protein